MTASEVVPFTLVFLFFFRGKFHFGAKFMLVPAKGTVMGGQQVCNQTFRPDDDGK